MRAVMLSVRPKWCELIASGKKTIEVRKSRPKQDTPFRCYIYETRGVTDTPFADEEGHLVFRGRGQVVGEFVCDRIYQYSTTNIEGQDILAKDFEIGACLSYEELSRYEHSRGPREGCIYLVGLYGWHISELKLYDRPKGLNEFGKVAPQRCDARNCECCDHWMSMRVNAEEFDMECDCDYEVMKFVQLKRAPQSWCYVEEKT